MKELSAKPNKLATLFASMFYISSFTFGGGFVIATFMKKKFVDQLHWIDEQEMLDMIALAQSSPGAIAVNTAILVGWQVCGLAGMLTAVLGTILPPMIILSVISFFYEAFASNPFAALIMRGMQAGVAAIILDVVWGLAAKVLKEQSRMYAVIMAAAFCAAFFFDLNVIIIIAAAFSIGLLSAVMKRKGA